MYLRSGESRATQPRGLLFLPTSDGQTSSASVSHHEGPASTRWSLDMSAVGFLVAVYPLPSRALVNAAIPPSTTLITHSSTRARHIQNHDFCRTLSSPLSSWLLRRSSRLRSHDLHTNHSAVIPIARISPATVLPRVSVVSVSCADHINDNRKTCGPRGCWPGCWSVVQQSSADGASVASRTPMRWPTVTEVTLHQSFLPLGLFELHGSAVFVFAPEGTAMRTDGYTTATVLNLPTTNRLKIACLCVLLL